MCNKKSCCVLITLLLLLAGPGQADEPARTDPARDLTGLQARYGKLISLAFDFTQQTRTQVRVRQGRGTAIFVRIKEKNNPGIMRWNYTEPEKQIILNTGEELSIYNDQEHQLLVMPAATVNDDITYSLFSGRQRLEDLFSVQPPDQRFLYQQPDTALKTLRLVPKKTQPQVKSIQLWFDSDYLIHHLVIEDHFETITEMNFNNIRINTIDPDDPAQIRKITHLDLPDDVEILNQ